MENWPKNLSGLEQQRKGESGVDKRLAHLICGDKKSPRASRIHFTRQATCQVPGQSRKMWKMRDMFVHDVNKASHSGASVLCNDSKLGDLLTIDFLLVLVVISLSLISHNKNSNNSNSCVSYASLATLTGVAPASLCGIFINPICNRLRSAQKMQFSRKWARGRGSYRIECLWAEVVGESSCGNSCAHTPCSVCTGIFPFFLSVAFVHFKFSVNFCFAQPPLPHLSRPFPGLAGFAVGK